MKCNGCFKYLFWVHRLLDTVFPVSLLPLFLNIQLDAKLKCNPYYFCLIKRRDWVLVGIFALATLVLLHLMTSNVGYVVFSRGWTAITQSCKFTFYRCIDPMGQMALVAEDRGYISSSGILQGRKGMFHAPHLASKAVVIKLDANGTEYMNSLYWSLCFSCMTRWESALTLILTVMERFLWITIKLQLYFTTTEH